MKAIRRGKSESCFCYVMAGKVSYVKVNYGSNKTLSLKVGNLKLPCAVDPGSGLAWLAKRRPKCTLQARID